jgi:alpha-1,3-mannosyl-glycoprotein beta-1,2-N-acetylglucosaminyltransferase
MHPRSSKNNYTKPSFRNTIIGGLVIFVCCTLLFMYHSHVSTDMATNTSILAEISALKASLSRHESNEEKSKSEIKDILPVLARSITHVKKESSEKHEGIHGRLSEIQDTFQELQSKVEMLNHHIEDHKRQHDETQVSSNLRGVSVKTATSVKSATSVTSRSASSLGSLGEDTILLVVASSRRPEYLKRCLTKITEYHPLGSTTIVVSEDGKSSKVLDVVNNARHLLKDRHNARIDKSLRLPQLLHINHLSQERFENGYFALSSHYKWALEQVFKKINPIFTYEGDSHVGAHVVSEIKRVVILEEDLEISPDFFEYFGALAPILDRDDKLLTVSAWNDNGQKEHVRDPSALYRSDFFPGLGWMMTRKLFNELHPKWPRAYWDDWLREPNQRKDRHTIRPEISRTFHYGKSGTSGSQFQSQYMDKMLLNKKFVHFSLLDLSYLHDEKWDKQYLQQVNSAELITKSSFDEQLPRSRRISSENIPNNPKEYRVEYIGNEEFARAAHWIGIMDNIKANVPRTAYKGIVSFWVGDVKLHLIPRM